MNSRESCCTPGRLSTATSVARANTSCANSSRSGAIAPTAFRWAPSSSMPAVRKGCAARVTSVTIWAPLQASAAEAQAAASMPNSSPAFAANDCRESARGLYTCSHSIGGDTRAPAGAQVAECKGFDHRDERPILGAPEKQKRTGAALRVRPGLGADELVELAAGRVQIVLAVLQQRLRHVLSLAARFCTQGRFKGRDRFLEVHQPDDVGLGDPDRVSRHFRP